MPKTLGAARRSRNNKKQQQRANSGSEPQQSISATRAIPKSDEQVDAAVQGLERGIAKLTARYERRCRQRHQLDRDDDDCLPEWEAQRLRQLQRRFAVVVAHTRHCWTALRRQLRALQAGLDCFRHQVLARLTEQLLVLGSGGTTNKNHTTALLQHVFQLLLRLHDGYILCVSGECRHAADIQTAQQSQYPSRLNQQQQSQSASAEKEQQEDDEDDQQRNKGGTLYSETNVYSGTSWDEWMDARCGLRQRLLALLQHLVPPNQQQQRDGLLWDTFTECGQPAAALEALVGETEVQMQQLQSVFTALIKTEMIQRVRAALQQQHGAGSTVQVNLQWQDKMEQLHVVVTSGGSSSSSSHQNNNNNNKWTARMERYAGDFQVSGGALPIGWTRAEDWWRGAMQWPATVVVPQKKKRRVIVESSSSSDEDDHGDKKPKAITKNQKQQTGKENRKEPSAPPPPPPPAAAGLVVKVVEAKPEKVTTETSVHAIKEKLGVNVDVLRAAREGLEAEEAAATSAAAVVDQAPVDDDGCKDPQAQEDDKRYAIRTSEQRVRRLRKALRRTLEGDNGGDDDGSAVWNAREVLREALMHVGGLILWSSSSDAGMNNVDNDDVMMTGVQTECYARPFNTLRTPKAS